MKNGELRIENGSQALRPAQFSVRAILHSVFGAASSRRTVPICGRRGFILPVMLLILALLGLLAAGFTFQVNADYAATRALVEKLQTRLAAEAGFHYVTLMLRDHLYDVDAWYDDREKLRGVVVWTSTGGMTAFGAVEEQDAEGRQKRFAPTYRVSLVADDPADDLVSVRYGLTDESAKLNINVATAEQLTRLLEQVAPELQEGEEGYTVAQLVDALLDWRDPDEAPLPNGAESDYYRGLKVPYRCKNGPFETVEELLMVRGFTGRILYGEDADRNGLLTWNEDDGNATFPPDDEDGTLNRGLYPYVTVYSRDFNRANDHQARVVLTGNSRENQERLSEFFEPHEVNFLLTSGSSGGKSKGQSKPKTLSMLVAPASTNGVPSPFELDDFPRIVDRCTYNPSPELVGQINVNTAPPAVLRCLTPLSEEEVATVVEKRVGLSPEDKRTTAWLLTQGVLTGEKYDLIEPMVTARGLQFTAEAIGYADHIGQRTRLQVVFEMRGPVPQILYYRDLTNLGVTFPLTREEEESGGVTRGPGRTSTG